LLQFLKLSTYMALTSDASMNDEMESINARMSALETEVSQPREGHCIVNKRYAESLASLKNTLDFLPKQQNAVPRQQSRLE
jgi:hypothetical protein